MIVFRKLFKFPSPTELHMSDSDDAMPSREFAFGKHTTRPTWEDYEEHLSKTFPVKYWITSTMPYFFLCIWWDVRRPFIDAKDWFMSHFVPSRRFHMLDLRQPKSSNDTDDAYRYGWLDCDHRMVFAMFNTLDLFMRAEFNRKWTPSAEDIAKEFLQNGIDHADALQAQRDRNLELRTIHDWWVIDRKTDLLAEKALADSWYMGCNTAAGDLKQAQLRDLEDTNAKKLEEMLHRLVDARHAMWS